MTKPFRYSTTYVLDKSHYSETFDESVTVTGGFGVYAKSLILTLLGLAALYVTEISVYIAWFLIALGGVEALSVRYKKPWWLARQMMSKAANSEVTISIDEKGISIRSLFVDNMIAWTSITSIKQTEHGWLLHQGVARSYLSNRCLSDQAIQYIRGKVQAQTG